jgi:LacI family transcriptional regulator
MATMKDVARAAGVSIYTVSAAFSGSAPVSPALRARVNKAVKALGYERNSVARDLRKGTSSLIGLIVSDVTNPFFTEFATSVQMALSAKGFAVVLANTDEDPALQAQVVSAMLEHGVSALILSPAYGAVDATFDAIARANVPTMQVLRRAVPDVTRFPFAVPDYRAGSRMATDHLLACGARRIAFLGGLEGREVTEARMSGYLAALAAVGMEALYLPGRPSRAFGREAALRLAADHPDVDAVLCFSDLVALGILSGCAEIGRQVGRDLKVVGFDNIEECAQVWPGLSSVRCDIAGFGRGVAETVLAWLETGRCPQPETVTPVDLMIRASSRS